MNHPSYELYHGDCLEVMKDLESSCVDTILTDPPYGLKFMEEHWDHSVPGKIYWEEMLRIAKPGAFLFSFGGTRTFHRLICAIEDAGWEIRDCIMWVYGTGFPKSLNLSKAMDKEDGLDREVIGFDQSRFRANRIKGSGNIGNIGGSNNSRNTCNRTDNGATITAPASEESKKWEGWGTALKPAWEPIVVAMKPLEGTYVQNAKTYGVSGLNIDGSRTPTTDKLTGGVGQLLSHIRDGKNGPGKENNGYQAKVQGRWPTNLIHDGSDEVLTSFPSFHSGNSPSRFFYCVKANKNDRNGSKHPTIKPLDLMDYLCRITSTPTGGVVLDPFMGTCTTGISALRNNRSFIGIEINEESFLDSKKRLEEEKQKGLDNVWE